MGRPLIASVVPAAPQRSLFNSVYYDDPDALAMQVDALAEVYESQGVSAWTVWVPDRDAAFVGEEAVGCVGSIEAGEDCCITGVATPSEWRGKGIASWLLCRALAGAREQGLTSALLQATRAGAPIYERLGFRDLGHIEMWELRR